MTSWGRKGPGGSGDLQNRTDPPLAGWVGSIPTRSRHAGFAGKKVDLQRIESRQRHAPHRPHGGGEAAGRGDACVALGYNTARTTWIVRRVGGTHASPCGRASARRVSVIVGAMIIATTTIGASRAAAQQPDSARAGIRRQTAPDTTPPTLQVPPGPRVEVLPATPRTGPPISPKAAFLYSLALPGLGQAKLDRSYAAGMFFTVEAVSFEMARQALVDLKYAQAHVHDSTLVVQTYQVDSLGQALRDSTGKPIPATYAYARYDSARVDARKTHLEDWIAVIIFNHLLSGADAFVAAQLWDLPAHVHPVTGMSADGRSRLYGMSVSW